jgi:hypothetical protein
MLLVNKANTLLSLLFVCVFNVYPQYINVGDTISAGIIYNNIPDVVLGNYQYWCFSPNWDSTDVDIDADNIKDIRFISYCSHSSSHHNENYWVRSINSLEFDTLSYGRADTIGDGQLLNSMYNWYGSTDKLTLRYYFYGAMGSGSGGVFSMSANNYLGFRKVLNNDTLYGWFLVQCDGKLRVKSYAYKNSLYASVNEYAGNGDLFGLFPNPASSSVFLNIKEQIENFYLINPEGQKFILYPDKNRINISAFPNGIYFLQIQTAKAVYREKLIIFR